MLLPEAKERTLLRGVLRWVGCRHPGNVARIADTERDPLMPMLWHVGAELSDGTPLRLRLVVKEERVPVCLSVDEL